VTGRKKERGNLCVCTCVSLYIKKIYFVYIGKQRGTEKERQRDRKNERERGRDRERMCGSGKQGEIHFSVKLPE